MRKHTHAFGPLMLTGALTLALAACGGASGNHVMTGTAGDTGSGTAGTTDMSGSSGTNGAAGISSPGTGGTATGSGTGGTTGASGDTGSGMAGTTAGTGGSGSGGAAGNGQSGGVSGAAGAAGGATGTGTGGAAGAADNGYTGPFTCTLVSGLLVTSEWFNAGFENDGLDGTVWEGKFQHYGYIDIWAQDPPAGFAWTAPITSACTKNSTNPDRVIFTAWSWELGYMEDKYIADTVQDIMEFKKNFPNIKRFELATIVRCPNNQMCNPKAAIPPIPGVTDHNAGQQDCYVAPDIDDALSKVAAMFPGWAFVAPKWESPSCENPVNGAHLYHENPAIAKMIATYFMSNP